MRYIRIRKLKKEEKNGIMVLAGILVVSILFSCTTATFATGANFLRQMVIMIIIATGMTFVVSTGEMDISVGAIYNLAVNVMALLTLHTGLSPWLWAPVGILIGAACAERNFDRRFLLSHLYCCNPYLGHMYEDFRPHLHSHPQ